jgi:MFS family permease
MGVKVNGTEERGTTIRSLPDSQDSGVSSPKYAWYVVAVLTGCYTLSFVDRQILSLLVRPIKQDLALNDTQIGLLQGLAFAVFYTLCGLPIGRIADQHTRKNVIAVGILLWSLFTSTCSIARGFAYLFLARMGVGIGEATLNPSAFSLISDYFPKERLGAALGVYSMGIFIGSGGALIFGGTVIEALARWPLINVPVLGNLTWWRVTFLAVGAPGVLAAFWMYTLREPVRRDVLSGREGRVPRLSLKEAKKQICLRWGSLVGLSLGIAGQAMSTYAFLAWAPSYFERHYGWMPGQAGRQLGWMLLIACCPGMYAGGCLSDNWLSEGVRNAPLRVGVLSAFGTGILFTIALSRHSSLWTVLWLLPALFFLSLPVGSTFAALQLIMPNQVRAQVSAIFTSIVSIVGLTLGPLLPGVLNDYLFRDERMIHVSLLLTILFASIIMLVAFRMTFTPYRRDYLLLHPDNS